MTPFTHPDAMPRLSRTAAVLLCCGMFAAAQAQGVQQPANVPASQLPTPPVKAQQPSTAPAATPADQSTAPAGTQQQSEAPEGAPVAQERSVPHQLPIPRAMRSMMPKEPGTEIDRVVAIVNGAVVLDSDVDEERRFESIQPRRNTSPDAGSSPRDQEIERLVDRDLILQQAKLQSDEVITDAALDKQIGEIRRTIPECKQYDCVTDAGWDRFLEAHGFTPAEFRLRWRQRMEVLAFINERFGAGASVSAAQVRAFYQNNMLPQYAKAHAKPAPLASVEPQIREILQQQQVSSLLRDWLQSLRAQGSITVLHPGEEAP